MILVLPKIIFIHGISNARFSYESRVLDRLIAHVVLYVLWRGFNCISPYQGL